MEVNTQLLEHFCEYILGNKNIVSDIQLPQDDFQLLTYF